MCRVCSRRIHEGRSGSLTQWIFAEHICKCKVPQPMTLGSATLDTSKIAIQDTSTDRIAEEDSEEVLEVDESLFPTNRYRPLKLLGHGALGQVYLCRDLHLSKLLAVKCLIGLTDERVVSFQQEAKIVSKLNHENIIKVFDFGTAFGGRPYMVMEYFDGRSLQELLVQKVRLNEDEARVILSGVCEALCYLHENQIFHRDLKPSNIMIGADNTQTISVRLIDFGLSKTTQDVQSKTLVQGRTVVGTPSYMSPDQVSGLEYDARSEIYSLGCIMYEVLTGELPFEGETSFEILNQHLTASVPSPKEFSPGLSNGICEITIKCLSKSREDRFQSVREIQKALSDTSETVANTATINESPATIEDLQSDRANRFVGVLKSHWILIASSFTFVIFCGAIVISILADASKNEMTRPQRESFVESERILTPDLTKNLSEGTPQDQRDLFKSQLLSNIRALALNGLRTDDDLRILQGKTSIEEIDLARSSITDNAIQYLVKIPNLTKLILSRTNVTSLTGLNQAKKIQSLDLNSTNVTDAAVDNVVGIRGLKELYLGKTKITDRGVEKLTHLSQLKVLTLKQSPQLGTATIRALKKMPGLNQIDLTDTSFSAFDIEDLARSNRSLKTIFFTGTDSEYERLETEFPTISFSDDRLCQIDKWKNIALAKHSKGKSLEALEFWKKVVSAIEHRTNEPCNDPVILNNLCVCYFNLGQYDLAERSQRQVLQAAQKQNDERQVLDSMSFLFNVTIQQGDNEKTEKLGQQLLKQSAMVNGRPSKADAEVQFSRIVCWYAGSQQIEKCLKATKQLLKDYRVLYGGTDRFTATATVIEGKCLEQLHRPKESLAKYEEARKLFPLIDRRAMTSIQRSQMADMYIGLIRLALERRDYETALAMTDEVLQMVPPSHRPQIIQFFDVRIAILEKQNRKDEAQQTREVRKRLIPS